VSVGNGMAVGIGVGQALALPIRTAFSPPALFPLFPPPSTPNPTLYLQRRPLLTFWPHYKHQAIPLPYSHFPFLAALSRNSANRCRTSVYVYTFMVGNYSALTEVTLLGPQAFGRPSPTMSIRRAHMGCRRRPTTGTKCPGRTIFNRR